MSDANHSNPIEITEPSSLNEQAAVALVIAGALVAVTVMGFFAGVGHGPPPQPSIDDNSYRL